MSDSMRQPRSRETEEGCTCYVHFRGGQAILNTLQVHAEIVRCDLCKTREQRITRAIAHANKYRHPGTNAGDHKVLSEMVEILEGGAK